MTIEQCRLRARALRVLCAGVFITGFGVLRVAQAAEPPPVEHYTKWPAIERVVISPSGKHAALLMYTGGQKHRALAVMDLPPSKEGAKVIMQYKEADIGNVQWVNDERLVYEGWMQGPEIPEGGAATFAINRDGSHDRRLIEWRSLFQDMGTRISSRLLPYGWFLHSTLDDGSDDVLVYREVTDGTGEHVSNTLARLNTINGQLRTLSTDMPPYVLDFTTDGRGEPFLVRAHRQGRSKVYLRDKAGAWQLLQDAEDFGNTGRFSRPLQVDGDGKLLVLARAGLDHTALYRYDTAKKELESDPLVAVKGFDLDATAELDHGSRELLGLHFSADRPMSVWFDDKLQALQAGIDKALPAGRTNRVQCGRCTTTRFFIIQSESDREPGEYYLFDRQEGSMQRIGARRPWIKEDTQGRRSFHRVKTRDGLEMPVYVTHPPGASATEPLPAVVLVHGGPNLRGVDSLWSDDAQFLASRGYRVIEPEFRGSSGYGWKLFRAGWQQWGRTMQDDLLDALDWAAQSKLVDRQRACIMGASYGGYAALMGPIRHPDAWRCAISFAGVTDIETMFTEQTSDMSEEARRYGMKRLVGDPKEEAQRWQEVSPVAQVGRIKVPVLLAHGQFDRRVPPAHADDFVSAAKRAGVKIDYVKYDRDGHGWHYAEDHADFLKRVEAFLAKSLKD